MGTQPDTQQSREQQSAWPSAIALVALLILGGLLLPVFLSHVPRPIPRVHADISALEGALADFKANFGIYPPSRLTLYSAKEDWDTDARSKAIIRTLWPMFDFNTPTYPPGFFKEGETQKSLSGSECLVFFLGGVADKTGVFMGFSKNPAEPFSLDGPWVGPFFEFDPARLVDTDRDGLLEYIDPQADAASPYVKPYVYYSSYEGRGYDPQDTLFSGVDFYKKNSTTAWNPGTFQIISPGVDGEYGPGGIYDPATADTDLTGSREAERDNITNFVSGTLVE